MISCPWAPMLNRPVRNASETARPPQISGVAWVSDSVIGVTPPIAPRASALYASPTAVKAAEKVSIGAAPKYPAAVCTWSSPMMIRIAPTTSASTIALSETRPWIAQLGSPDRSGSLAGTGAACSGSVVVSVLI